MKTAKKLLSIVLAAVLIFTLLPARTEAASSVVKVTWNANGGKIGSKKTTITIIKKGAKIGKLPKTPTRTGYKFKGWYTKKSGGAKITKAKKPKKNVTYYAQWNSAAQIIPLASLRQLAAKGYELTFEDFNGYMGQDIGSGLYILYFQIEGGYNLLVGGDTATGKPFYAFLSIPGVEDKIDIRYADIDEFISKHPVPNELSNQVYGYLDTIMSSPSLSSATGDYIKAHQAEYDAIVDMGVTALPTLTGILNNYNI